MLLFLLVLVVALAFEYINGFHDAANAIATVVSTKVLTPRQAIFMAAFFNMLGAFMGTAVASTVGKGLVDTKAVTMHTVLAALIGAIFWNLLTWWIGLPSSSSHALVGGLCVPRSPPRTAIGAYCAGRFTMRKNIRTTACGRSWLCR
jgi:inorganic phosphate transporter, PiT family